MSSFNETEINNINTIVPKLFIFMIDAYINREIINKYQMLYLTSNDVFNENIDDRVINYFNLIIDGNDHLYNPLKNKIDSNTISKIFDQYATIYPLKALQNIHLLLNTKYTLSQNIFKTIIQSISQLEYSDITTIIVPLLSYLSTDKFSIFLNFISKFVDKKQHNCNSKLTLLFLLINNHHYKNKQKFELRMKYLKTTNCCINWIPVINRNIKNSKICDNNKLLLITLYILNNNFNTIYSTLVDSKNNFIVGIQSLPLLSNYKTVANNEIIKKNILEFYSNLCQIVKKSTNLKSNEYDNILYNWIITLKYYNKI